MLLTHVQVDDDLYSFFMLLQLLARVMLVRQSIQEVIKYKSRHQHYEHKTKSRQLTGRHLQRIVWFFILTSLVMECVCIVCFILFYHLVHLGWTTLVNNAALIIATVLSNLVLKKIQRVQWAIIEDEHKVVLYEAMLLLKEGSTVAPSGGKERDQHYDKVLRYIKSLLDTELFQQPRHIQLMDKYSPHWDTVTTMEAVSLI